MSRRRYIFPFLYNNALLAITPLRVTSPGTLRAGVDDRRAVEARTGAEGGAAMGRCGDRTSLGQGKCGEKERRRG